jgi:hypothetical protein
MLRPFRDAHSSISRRSDRLEALRLWRKCCGPFYSVFADSEGFETLTICDPGSVIADVISRSPFRLVLRSAGLGVSRRRSLPPLPYSNSGHEQRNEKHEGVTSCTSPLLDVYRSAHLQAKPVGFEPR